MAGGQRCVHHCLPEAARSCARLPPSGGPGRDGGVWVPDAGIVLCLPAAARRRVLSYCTDKPAAAVLSN